MSPEISDNFQAIPAQVTQFEHELNRLNARRRAGLLMMYAPAMGLGVVLSAAVSLPNAGSVTTAISAIGIAAILLGLVTAPVGIVVRVVYGARLNHLTSRLQLDQSSDLPPLRKGARIGNWRIARWTGEKAILIHEPGSRVISFAARLAVEAVLMAMLIVVIINSVRSPNNAAWASVVFVALLGTGISASLGGGRLEIDHPATSPSIRFSGYRVWSLFNIAGWRIPFDTLEDVVILADRLIIEHTHGTRAVAGFGAGAFDRWQMRRLCAATLGETPIVSDAGPFAALP